MKHNRWIKIGVVVFLMVWCLGIERCQINENDAMLTAVELGAYNVGYYVGKSRTEADDLAIANAYKLAREGRLPPEQVGQSMAALKLDNPQLAGSVLILLKNMGAAFTADGGLVSVSGIPIDYWDRAADGYVAGYALGKLGQKGGIGPTTDSAVKRFMPSK